MVHPRCSQGRAVSRWVTGRTHVPPTKWEDHMKHLTSLLLVCAMAVFGVFATTSDSQAQERYGKQKVVYHINYNGGEEDKAYRGALRNMQNHINAVGAENMEIKLVLAWQRAWPSGCGQNKRNASGSGSRTERSERVGPRLQQHSSRSEHLVRG